MSQENLEEWDASFLEELIQVEELALSSSSVNQNNHPSSSYLRPLPPPPTPPPLHNQLLQFPPPSRTDSLSYSPPRELSQRTANLGGPFTLNVVAKCTAPSTAARCILDSDNAKDLEIERLKKELGHVSKQLADVEHECLELNKERNMEGWLKFADSRNEKFDGLRIANSLIDREHGIPVPARHGFIQQSPKTKAFDDQTGLHTANSRYKTVGVQTDQYACLDLSKKLQGVWDLPSNQNLGRSLISKLFSVCSTDIDILFGFIRNGPHSKIMEPHAIKNSADMSLQQSMHHFLSSEAVKVSNFYSALTKISSGALQFEALFESLFDLCSVENVVILYRSLHILHILLKHLITFERKCERRENILVECLHSGSSSDDKSGCEARGQVFAALYATCFPNGVRHTEADTVYKKESCYTGSPLVVSHINWISLFELMRLIVMKSDDECIRLEAVSIMNVILMRIDAYTERERFGPIFGSISQLLKKEAGLLVQKEAVHTLYLLLNCPKLVITFCSGCTIPPSASAAIDEADTTAFQEFSRILEGLAECIACCGNSLQALELCKNTITLLAFVASSGKSGFEILVNHKLSRERNFLSLILQQLASEIDLEAAISTESSEIFRARTLLIREVLILLNRLVASPVNSPTVLRLLTNSRDMVTLTIDVANRLSRKVQNLRQSHSDSITKHVRESEIVDLARIFKRRVSAYLGE